MKYSSSSSEWDWEFESITTTDYRREDIIIPEWVSFEPIEFQIIWQDTAGKRKIQPRKEREKFEEIWLKNTRFKSICSTTPVPYYYGNIQKHIYGVMALRSFFKSGPYGIQITHLRISIDIKTQSFCEYLINFKTPTYEYSIWKRYSLIKSFYNHILEKYPDLPLGNTKNSWSVLNSWKSWLRNLEMPYLQKKAFFLERVLHDALYELDEPSLFLLYFT
jgi:hypothetical protein|tara:strand:- start:3078 stop:3734 length:657 start_codon:yes stop_codon:yes gene_type:complete